MSPTLRNRTSSKSPRVEVTCTGAVAPVRLVALQNDAQRFAGELFILIEAHLAATRCGWRMGGLSRRWILAVAGWFAFQCVHLVLEKQQLSAAQ